MPNAKNGILSSTALLAAFSLLISSCAATGPAVSREDRKRAQEEFNVQFLESSGKWLDRIYRVGYRLVSSPVPGHGSETEKYGFVGVGVGELEDYVRKYFSIGEKVKGVWVQGTYPGSKAEGVDVLPGDVIIGLDGKKIKNIGKYFKAVRSSRADQMQAEIIRKGKTITRTLPLEHVYYNAQFFLGATPDVDAGSLYSKVVIGIGAIRYCRNDDELAVIMGHELAHTTLKHSLKTLGVGTVSAVGYGVLSAAVDYFTFFGVGGLITGPVKKATDAAVSRRYEREADYTGLRHAFHSGYNVEHGARVFGRLAVDSPDYALLAYTFSSHPMFSERALRLEQITKELEALFPGRAVAHENQDWEITVPLESGETLQDALRRLAIQEKTPVSGPVAA